MANWFRDFHHNVILSYHVTIANFEMTAVMGSRCMDFLTISRNYFLFSFFFFLKKKLSSICLYRRLFLFSA